MKTVHIQSGPKSNLATEIGLSKSRIIINFKKISS